MVGSSGDPRAASAAAVAGAAAGQRADAAGGGEDGFRRSTGSAIDAARAGDAERAADRPLRRPWRAAAAIGAWPRAPRLMPSQARQRADAWTRLAAGQTIAAWCFAALRMSREPEICVAAGIAPRGGPDGWCRRSECGLACCGAEPAAVGRCKAVDGGEPGECRAS